MATDHDELWSTVKAEAKKHFESMGYNVNAMNYLPEENCLDMEMQVVKAPKGMQIDRISLEKTAYETDDDNDIELAEDMDEETNTIVTSVVSVYRNAFEPGIFTFHSNSGKRVTVNYIVEKISAEDGTVYARCTLSDKHTPLTGTIEFRIALLSVVVVLAVLALLNYAYFT